jgi:hypothetical protein
MFIKACCPAGLVWTPSRPYNKCWTEGDPRLSGKRYSQLSGVPTGEQKLEVFWALLETLNNVEFTLDLALPDPTSNLFSCLVKLTSIIKSGDYGCCEQGKHRSVEELLDSHDKTLNLSALRDQIEVSL